MERPLDNKRPVGPFAQMGSEPELKAIIFYETEIPSDMQDEVAEAVEFHLDSHGADVSSVMVGPENTNDSVIVTFSDDSFVDEDLSKGISASVAEMEDMGLNPTRDPEAEIFLQ